MLGSSAIAYPLAGGLTSGETQSATRRDSLGFSIFVNS